MAVKADSIPTAEGTNRDSNKPLMIGRRFLMLVTIVCANMQTIQPVPEVNEQKVDRTTSIKGISEMKDGNIKNDGGNWTSFVQQGEDNINDEKGGWRFEDEWPQTNEKEVVDRNWKPPWPPPLHIFHRSNKTSTKTVTDIMTTYTNRKLDDDIRPNPNNFPTTTAVHKCVQKSRRSPQDGVSTSPSYTTTKPVLEYSDQTVIHQPLPPPPQRTISHQPPLQCKLHPGIILPRASLITTRLHHLRPNPRSSQHLSSALHPLNPNKIPTMKKAGRLSYKLWRPPWLTRIKFGANIPILYQCEPAQADRGLPSCYPRAHLSPDVIPPTTDSTATMPPAGTSKRKGPKDDSLNTEKVCMLLL